jgi:serine/threonine-protein kinase
MECPSCGAVAPIINLNPLTIVKCADCGEGIFIPYCVKDFWLYRPLGGGGMGSVYKAFCERNQDQDYAVKILARQKKTEQFLIDALIREAGVGKSFGRHPHLVFVVDYGRDGDEYFNAMEFCVGKRLDQLIEDPDMIPQKFILLWALQILSAEQRMFECGFFFRDLKPQNIIVDDQGNAKLIDYGLCEKVESLPREDADSIEGSPLYIPPERIIGAMENMSSEIYSLGMVMFHALAKKTYYTATGAYELAHKHIAGVRMASVSSRIPAGINPKISALIDKMIARNPPDRLQTYKETAFNIKSIYNSL